MSKPEWGLKRVCPSCGTRYYDMMKSPPVCPNCGTAFDPEALLKSRRTRTSSAADDLRRGTKRRDAPVAGDLPDETDLEEAEGRPDEGDGESLDDANDLGEDDVADVEIPADGEEER